MKLRSVLFFTLFLLSFANVCLAQAVEEQPVTEEPAKDEQITEPPAKEEPTTEEKAKPTKREKKKKKKSQANEESAVEELPKDESVIEEPIAPKEKETGSEEVVPESEGVVTDQVAPVEEPKEKEEQKKDTWFRIFKMKRCPIKSCDTKMVHTHEGKKFRGVKKIKIIQNPKTGELVREPVTDPKEHKKSPKVRKKREYQKKFKLPKKHK